LATVERLLEELQGNECNRQHSGLAHGLSDCGPRMRIAVC